MSKSDEEIAQEILDYLSKLRASEDVLGEDFDEETQNRFYRIPKEQKMILTVHSNPFNGGGWVPGSPMENVECKRYWKLYVFVADFYKNEHIDPGIAEGLMKVFKDPENFAPEKVKAWMEKNTRVVDLNGPDCDINEFCME